MLPPDLTPALHRPDSPMTLVHIAAAIARSLADVIATRFQNTSTFGPNANISLHASLLSPTSKHRM